MTSEDIESELGKEPFGPFRLHLVSGKTVDVRSPGDAYMLRSGVLVFQAVVPADRERRYDAIDLLNIERLEQIEPESMA